MNLRIRELFLEADFPKIDIENEAQRFAELIVRECVAVVDSMTDPEDSEQYFWAIQNASQKIKKHFGVES